MRPMILPCGVFRVYFLTSFDSSTDTNTCALVSPTPALPSCAGIAAGARISSPPDYMLNEADKCIPGDSRGEVVGLRPTGHQNLGQNPK